MPRQNSQWDLWGGSAGNSAGINPNDELIQDGFLTAHLPRQCWVLQWRKHAKTIMVYTGAICLIRPLQLVGFLIDLHIDMFDI